MTGPSYLRLRPGDGGGRLFTARPVIEGPRRKGRNDEMSGKPGGQGAPREPRGPGRGFNPPLEEYAPELDTPRNTLYKPKGTPRGRERTSQKAQLESVHRQGTNKAIKRSIESKTGLAEF